MFIIKDPDRDPTPSTCDATVTVSLMIDLLFLGNEDF
jgi:hypothetical protein